MKKIIWIVILLISFWNTPVFGSEVDYSIKDYDAILKIHEDNSADFTQTIVYHFDSVYNGQIVTLGEAGKMPQDFSIDSLPRVEVYNNGTYTTVDSEVSNLNDGYQVKIYNAGSNGDVVKVVVHWTLHNILYLYQDVAELNWTPISDWDETLKKVRFTVITDKEVEDSQFWGHAGYFHPIPSVEKVGSTYTISTSDISSKLELHAYWDKDVISSSNQLSGLRKSKIINQEKRILWFGQFINNFLTYILPLLLLVVFVYNLWKFSQVKKQLNKYNYFNRKDRLYEAPENLSPLVVSQNIYDLDFYQLGPSENKKGVISFENLLQSILLDLVDRKALSLSKNDGEIFIKIDSLSSLGEEELIFLDMAFGNSNELPLNMLFSRYQYNHSATLKQLKKTYRGDKLEKEVRKASRSILNDISSRSRSISSSVSKYIKKENLISPYRTLTEEESKTLRTLRGFDFFLGIISFVVLIYLLFNGAIQSLIYLALTILSILISFYMVKASADFFNHGVVTESGGDRLHQWQSFRNMIKTISSFNRAELESVIVWNRILVYATLFGYADRVEKYLRINQIKLPNDLSEVSTANFHHSLAMATNHFVTTSTSAMTSSNFSVSSSGSGGGGFSGGGGGGGGGAF